MERPISHGGVTVCFYCAWFFLRLEELNFFNAMKGFLNQTLAHPLTRGLDIDDPAVTLLRSRIMNNKSFLKQIYIEWYTRIARHFSSDALVLELGSGAGFLRHFLPRAIASEVFSIPGIDIVLDARAIGLGSKVLDGIVLLDVLHHIPDCHSFFQEAARTVRPGGAIVMIETWNTPWSRWVYSTFSPEPFDPEQQDWFLSASGPLSTANGALPWIVFKRDKALFAAEHPSLIVENIEPIMPLSYLFSGGVSLRIGLPGWMFKLVRYCEEKCCEKRCSMFAVIKLRRIV